MSILEEKIRKNRGHYDAREPEKGHFERFAARLDERFHEKKERPNRFRILRYAAAIILIAGISGILIYQYSGHSSKLAANPMAQELNTVKDHYNRLADRKLSQISSCAPTGEEAEKINGLATEQLQRLDEDAHNLEQELEKDGSNERVYGALVSNYRTRIKILDNIINQICQL